MSFLAFLFIYSQFFIISSSRDSSKKAYKDSNRSGERIRRRKEQSSAQSCYVPDPMSYTYEELGHQFENVPPVSPILLEYNVITSLNDNAYFNFYVNVNADGTMRNTRNSEESHQEQHQEDETHYKQEEHHQEEPQNVQVRHKSSSS